MPTQLSVYKDKEIKNVYVLKFSGVCYSEALYRKGFCYMTKSCNVCNGSKHVALFKEYLGTCHTNNIMKNWGRKT